MPMVYTEITVDYRAYWRFRNPVTCATKILIGNQTFDGTRFRASSNGRSQKSKRKRRVIETSPPSLGVLLAPIRIGSVSSIDAVVRKPFPLKMRLSTLQLSQRIHFQVAVKRRLGNLKCCANVLWTIGSCRSPYD